MESVIYSGLTTHFGNSPKVGAHFSANVNRFNAEISSNRERKLLNNITSIYRNSARAFRRDFHYGYLHEHGHLGRKDWVNRRTHTAC